MKITKAIIPVAGWGTRRLPITKAIEKCMLPVGNRPLVDYVVQDCIQAGITDIYFVVSEWMTQIQSYYSDNGALDTYLIGEGKEELLPLVKPPRDVSFHFIQQDTNGKYGTAIPVSLVLPYLDQGESVVLLMGDDFIYNADGSSEVKRLLEATPENGNAMLGANVPLEAVSRYGVIDMNERSEFIRIVEKPTPEEAPSTLVNISKYVFNHDLLKAVAGYAEVPLTGEYYITDPINQYVMNGGSIVVAPAKGEYLDGGSVGSWLHANNVVMAHHQ